MKKYNKEELKALAANVFAQNPQAACYHVADNGTFFNADDEKDAKAYADRNECKVVKIDNPAHSASKAKAEKEAKEKAEKEAAAKAKAEKEAKEKAEKEAAAKAKPSTGSGEDK